MNRLVAISGDRRRLVYYWAPLIACMAAIFALSSLSAETISGPARDTPGPGPTVKLPAAHVVEYAVLSVLAFRVVAFYRVLPTPYLWAVVLLFTVGYAATDELHQAFVPGRVPAWRDMAYDSIGATVGMLAAEVVARLRRRLGRAG